MLFRRFSVGFVHIHQRNHHQLSSVQLSRIQLFATPWTAAHQASLSVTNSRKLLKLIHCVSDAIQPSHPMLSPSPPAFSLSQHQGLFQWVSSSHQVAKVLEFQLQHQSFHEYSGLISFRIELIDLFAVQGTLKRFLQHHSSKASILWCSAFFIALTRWTFVGKVMSLLFNMLSRFVLAFLPRSKCLKFMAAVTICSDFGAQRNKVCHCFPIYLPWSDGTACHDLCLLNVEL